jgi:hypothetical protein
VAAVGIDPSDPIDAVLIKIHETNRRKRADYAVDGNPFSNFEGTARRLGIPGVGPLEACEFLIATKEERLAALRANRRGPQNESVLDTLLDRAVYAIIAYAIASQPLTPE